MAFFVVIKLLEIIRWWGYVFRKPFAIQVTSLKLGWTSITNGVYCLTVKRQARLNPLFSSTQFSSLYCIFYIYKNLIREHMPRLKASWIHETLETQNQWTSRGKQFIPVCLLRPNLVTYHYDVARLVGKVARFHHRRTHPFTKRSETGGGYSSDSAQFLINVNYYK